MEEGCIAMRRDARTKGNDVLTKSGRFMKGRDLLRSAFKEVTTRVFDCAGAKAEALAARVAVRTANFIMVNESKKEECLSDREPVG
jgi:hypothetical protein